MEGGDGDGDGDGVDGGTVQAVYLTIHNLTEPGLFLCGAWAAFLIRGSAEGNFIPLC